MAHWMHPPEIHPGKWDPLDSVIEWTRHGLSREQSLAIWEQACAQATDRSGRRDMERAQQRFHELAASIAARHGSLWPDVGKVTRVAAETDDNLLAAWRAHELRPRTPGRETLVAVDVRLRYDDYRVLGLKDVLQQMGPNHLLRQETIAAAANIDRSIAGRATLWREPLSGTTTPNGQALWHAAQRRAVTLYRRAITNGTVNTDDAAVVAALQQSGTGAPLPIEHRRELEREFEVSLAGVRLHLDGMAAQAARALEAEAFTVGEDIFFAEGAFAPDTRAGRKLLVHELTHVAQSLRGRTGPTGGGLRVSQPGEPLEQEADAVADAAVMRRPGAEPGPGSRLGEALSLAITGSPAKVPFQSTLERFFGRRLPDIVAFTGRSELSTFGARAASAGRNVVFAESAPSLPVVAHEVTHILQQEHAGSPAAELHKLADGDAPAEHEADAAAHAIASGDTAVFAVRERPAPIVHLNRDRHPEPTGPVLPHGASLPQHRIKGAPVGDVVAGTNVVYEVVMGFEMMSADSYYSFSWKCVNDPSTRGSAPVEVAGPRNYRWNAHWDFAGHHKIVCTVQFHPAGENARAPEELGYWQNVRSVEEVQEEKDDEAILRLVNPMAIRDPSGAAALAPGATKVTPEIAVKILENMAKGEPPFKPELGKGGCSWFVSEGNPYTGTGAEKNVSLPAEIDRTANPITFNEAKLQALYQEQHAKLDMAELEAKYREYKKLPPDQPLNSKARKGLERLAKEAAESKMWDQVGAEVKQSAAKVGEVILENSDFSKSGDGKFLVVADASKIKVKGGMTAVVDALEASGAKVEPVVAEAVAKTAARLKWAGRVRATIRYGGRILIVVAIAADVYRVYHAQDKVKAVVESAGGWTGATMAVAGFSEVFGAADTLGPWAWAAHGVGALIAGGIGYWVGSSTTRTIYEIIVEDP